MEYEAPTENGGQGGARWESGWGCRRNLSPGLGGNRLPQPLPREPRASHAPAHAASPTPASPHGAPGSAPRLEWTHKHLRPRKGEPPSQGCTAVLLQSCLASVPAPTLHSPKPQPLFPEPMTSQAPAPWGCRTNGDREALACPAPKCPLPSGGVQITRAFPTYPRGRD